MGVWYHSQRGIVHRFCGVQVLELSWWMWLVLPAVSLVAGFVDAIAGDGGLLTLPALLATGLPPHLCLGTNKAQAIWGSTGAAVSFWRQGRIDRQRALPGFVAGAVGSFAGAAAVLWVAPDKLRWVMVVLLVGAAVFMVLHRGVKDDATEIPPYSDRRFAAALGLACAIGAYDGFFGPGTGAFLIVAFAGVLREPLVNASANAKVVNVASNAAALLTFALSGHVFWLLALPMACAQLAGGYLGARVAVRGGRRLIRAATLMVVALLVARVLNDLLSGG
jgi:uncharacterized membrane protein YfcA